MLNFFFIMYDQTLILAKFYFWSSNFYKQRFWHPLRVLLTKKKCRNKWKKILEHNFWRDYESEFILVMVLSNEILQWHPTLDPFCKSYTILILIRLTHKCNLMTQISHTLSGHYYKQNFTFRYINYSIYLKSEILFIIVTGRGYVFINFKTK